MRSLITNASRWIARRILSAMDHRRKRIDGRTPFGTDPGEQ
jgi:hypothetical protein